jgi:hypothetical protein
VRAELEVDGDRAKVAGMGEQRLMKLARKFPRHVLKDHAEDRRKSVDKALHMHGGPLAVGESCHKEGLRILPALQSHKNVTNR